MSKSNENMTVFGVKIALETSQMEYKLIQIVGMAAMANDSFGTQEEMSDERLLCRLVRGFV